MSGHAKEQEGLEGGLKEREAKIKELGEKLSSVENEVKEHVTLLQRLQADFQNYMKQAEKERKRSGEKAREELVLKFINVCENMENAIKALPRDTDRKTAEGLKAVERQMKKVFGEEGVVKIKSVGEVFDPSRHDAAGTVDSKDKPEGTIIEEVLSGYTMNNNVLRHAKVIVSRKEVGKGE